MNQELSKRVSALSAVKLELLRRSVGAAAPPARLIAYVEVAGIPPDDDELESHLRERLPAHMIPSLFVTVDALPRLPNGKVARLGLPDPEQAAAAARRGYEAPQTRVEQVIADAWAEALGLDRVSRADDFFDLGGHSILATHMIAVLSRKFEVKLRLRVLFETPTVAGLAEHVEALLAVIPAAAANRGEREEFEI